MNYEDIFDSSYKRVMLKKTNDISFFDAFYDRFISDSPEVAKHFSRTDMDKQKMMLKKSFYSLFTFYTTNNSDDYLERIAKRHGKNELDVDPKLYDLWLENLVDTVKEFDPEFDKDVELAWRLVLCSGITYMKFKYDA